MTTLEAAPPDAGLTFRVTVARDAGFTLDVELDVRAGEVVALLGPNGAGKSTALHAVAGLVRPRAGTVVLDGRVLTDAASALHVPVERRRCGVLFQDHLLFPHLTATDNVAFGPLAQGADRRTARREAAAWLALLGVGDLGPSRPGKLSGGQAQRVALARALAGRPRALLLDEPFAALDAATRSDVRAVVAARTARFGGPVLLVTHDPGDALALADRVVVLERGRAVQSGPPAAVLRDPATEYVARLAGLNLYQGALTDRVVHLDQGGLLRVDAEPDGSGGGVPGRGHAGSRVRVVVPPRAVRLATDAPPPGADVTIWVGTVEAVEPAGEHLRVRVGGRPPVLAEMPLHDVPDGMRLGAQVWVAVPSAAARVLVPETSQETAAARE